MKATLDTNILLRAILDDHPTQSPAAQAMLSQAELVSVTLPTLCEFVWVLRKGYKRSRQEISAAIETIARIPTVSVDVPAIEAGLDLARVGGDFADGVIAFDGIRLGGEIFLTFDRDAAELLAKAGIPTSLLSGVLDD